MFLRVIQKKTIVFAKCAGEGGQTKCLMGDVEVVNGKEPARYKNKLC